MRYTYRCKLCHLDKDFDFPLGEAPESFIEGEDTSWSEQHIWRRVFSIAGIVFRGPGFYTTDRRRYKDVDTRFVKPDV